MRRSKFILGVAALAAIALVVLAYLVAAEVAKQYFYRRVQI
jgi:predicted small secreted protein